jgi:hypothetical protein
LSQVGLLGRMAAARSAVKPMGNAKSKSPAVTPWTTRRVGRASQLKRVQWAFDADKQGSLVRILDLQASLGIQGIARQAFGCARTDKALIRMAQGQRQAHRDPQNAGAEEAKTCHVGDARWSEAGRQVALRGPAHGRRFMAAGDRPLGGVAWA